MRGLEQKARSNVLANIPEILFDDLNILPKLGWWVRVSPGNGRVSGVGVVMEICEKMSLGFLHLHDWIRCQTEASVLRFDGRQHTVVSIIGFAAKQKCKKNRYVAKQRCPYLD